MKTSEQIKVYLQKEKAHWDGLLKHDCIAPLSYKKFKMVSEQLAIYLDWIDRGETNE